MEGRSKLKLVAASASDPSTYTLRALQRSTACPQNGRLVKEAALKAATVNPTKELVCPSLIR